MNNKSLIKNNSKSRRGFLLDIAKWIAGTALVTSTVNIFTSNKIQADPGSVNSYDAFVGEIMLSGFNFPPLHWASCEGQLIQISLNTALFSLLGTTFGGNGQTTFALPDLRGRVALHPGQGPGLPNYNLGEMGGEASHTLTINEIPPHSHSLEVNSYGGIIASPSTNYLASNSEGIKQYSNTAGSSANVASIGNSGGGQAHNNMPPFLAVYHSIALYGAFPSRP